MTRAQIDRLLDGCDWVTDVCAYLGTVLGLLITLPVWLPLMVIRR